MRMKTALAGLTACRASPFESRDPLYEEEEEMMRAEPCLAQEEVSFVQAVVLLKIDHGVEGRGLASKRDVTVTQKESNARRA